MGLKLKRRVSRKVGLPDYGSVGASCNLEVELDAGLIDRDLDAFHARVRGVYVAAHRPCTTSSPASTPRWRSRRTRRMPTRHASNGHVGGNGQATDRPPAGRSRLRKPATEAQVRAIRSIANRQHADLDGLVREFGVNRPEDLSLKQASELIDTLKTAAGI